jgi:mRNA-degrading endonuclease RelE of RelBE toxin-antitoxin system
MDALAKLLKRSSLKDQVALVAALQAIRDADLRKNLDMKKLSGGEFYRVRVGKFRIIFHFENSKASIDSVRFRNEKTYRGV